MKLKHIFRYLCPPSQIVTIKFRKAYEGFISFAYRDNKKLANRNKETKKIKAQKNTVEET